MKTAILVTGKTKAGKNYVSDIMQDMVKSRYTEMLHFADPIKDIISKTFEITREYIEEEKNKKDSPMREVLQRFGTEGMKPVFGEDVWVDLMIKKIKESDANVIIIPDWRFPNEYFRLFDEILDVVTIKVVSPNQDNSHTHLSENALKDIDIDYVINNDGKTDCFVAELDDILTKEGL